MSKILCLDHCCTATYYYHPAYDGKNEAESYYCDLCVPRNCAHCGTELKSGMDDEDPEVWNDPSNFIPVLDSKGLQVPCVEYLHDENGFEENWSFGEWLEENAILVEKFEP